MNTAIGLAFLVIIVVLEEAIGFPEQQLDLEYQGQDNDEEYLERKRDSCGTKSACKFSGGWCKPLTEECEGKWRTARFYCKNSRKCGCCIPAGPPGCVFGEKSYPDQAVNRETCVDLLCNKGVWEMQGDVKKECGNCTSYGDPHIYTYNPHHFDNGEPHNQLNADLELGEYTISQKGLDQSLFGVNATFEHCWNYTCVSIATYYEPGIKVELILPVNLFKDDDCRTSTSNNCTTKILVNEQERSINDSVISVFGTDGTVLIFDEYVSCNNCRLISVVGSKGLAIRLIVDPFDDSIYYSLRIYPMKSLQGPEHLFGLCDTFIIPKDESTYGYTAQNGALITNFDNIYQFINSWKVQ